VAIAAAAAIAVLVAIDVAISGPVLIDGYRGSADASVVTVTVILLPIDTITGQSLEEHSDRIVVSVRIRRPPAITTSVGVFREMSFQLRDPLGPRLVVDESGRTIRPQR